MVIVFYRVQKSVWLFFLILILAMFFGCVTKPQQSVTPQKVSGVDEMIKLAEDYEAQQDWFTAFTIYHDAFFICDRGFTIYYGGVIFKNSELYSKDYISRKMLETKQNALADLESDRLDALNSGNIHEAILATVRSLYIGGNLDLLETIERELKPLPVVFPDSYFKPDNFPNLADFQKYYFNVYSLKEGKLSLLKESEDSQVVPFKYSGVNVYFGDIPKYYKRLDKWVTAADLNMLGKEAEKVGANAVIKVTPLPQGNYVGEAVRILKPTDVVSPGVPKQMITKF